MVITRKIQIHLIEDENRQEHFEDIYRWQKICIRAANMVSSHLFFQHQTQDMFYLIGDVQQKLADANKTEDGMLNTSAMSTTYRLLSKHFKGNAPMSMLSALNSVISKTFKKEFSEVRKGTKSLRSYRGDIPMPLPSQQIKNIEQSENGNFEFMAFGKRFCTAFGRDASGNRLIMERAMSGEYKLCDSSIQLKKSKMFLLAVFQFEKEKPVLNPGKELFAELGVTSPIVCWTNPEKPYLIGNSEEYLHQRLSIQNARRRLQKSARYSKGGNGRKKKLKALDRYNEKEMLYIRTKLHTYSRELINKSIKEECGKIVLVRSDSADQNLLIRNWGWSGLMEFIKYKASAAGIEIEERVIDAEKSIVRNEILKQIINHGNEKSLQVAV